MVDRHALLGSPQNQRPRGDVTWAGCFLAPAAGSRPRRGYDFDTRAYFSYVYGAWGELRQSRQSSPDPGPEAHAAPLLLSPLTTALRTLTWGPYPEALLSLPALFPHPPFLILTLIVWTCRLGIVKWR